MLTVIIPVFNEEKTIAALIAKVDSLPVEKEIIVIDDCSKDKTAVILSSLALSYLKVIHHASNRGKAAAARTGIQNATQEFLIILDAGSKCDLNDYLKLLEAIKSQAADIALGVRLAKADNPKPAKKPGNCLAACLLNIFFGVKLSGWFTPCRLMRTESLLSLALELKRANIELEILAKAIRKKMRIIEVPLFK